MYTSEQRTDTMPSPTRHRRPMPTPSPEPRAVRTRRPKRKKVRGARPLIWLSALVSLTLLTLLLWTWANEMASTRRSEAIGQRVATMAQTEQYLRAAYPKGAPLRRVYTGLFVKSMEFDNSNTVTVSGYVWQRYPGGVPKGVTPGVAFPEATDSYSLAEVYRDRSDGMQTIGWHFQIQVREKFDYHTYPLDRQDVWLRMWHADFNSGALLVPDLSGYPPWQDKQFLGVDRETVFDEWVPNYTFFSYNKIPYSASFGYGRFVKATGRPELYFNMGFKRGVYGAFIGNLIPILFISVMMFASLFPGSIDTEDAEATGFNTLGFISFAVTLLLVAVFQHTTIRSAVGGGALSHLDYLMFVIYFVICLITLNAIVIRSVRPPRWIHWGNNLISKALYWPVLLSLMLAAAVVSFGVAV